MFKTTRAKMIGLAMVGIVALGGATYATTAPAVGGATASPVAARAVQAATDPQLRAGMLDMLEDHMGVSGPKAEQFADEMISHMQGLDEDFDVQEMLDWRTQYAGDSTYGPGMMGGYGMMYGGDWGSGGYGMMGGYGATTPSTAPTDQPSNPSGNTPSNPGSQNGGPGYYPGGMMNGGTPGAGMMPGYGTATPNTSPTDLSSNPSDNIPGNPGGMMNGAGGMMNGGTTGAGMTGR